MLTSFARISNYIEEGILINTLVEEEGRIRQLFVVFDNSKPFDCFARCCDIPWRKHCFIHLPNQKSQGLARGRMPWHARVLPRE